MSLLTAALKAKNISAAPNSNVGRIFGAEPVESDSELERIVALPRRRWEDDPNLEELVDLLSARYRRVPTARLFPMQAAALSELYTQRRVAVVASLGSGKTLCCALGPTVLGSTRPLFVTYSRLIEKTKHEMRTLLDSWNSCRSFDFLSFESWSREKQADYLERTNPDIIVIDESHGLAEPRGARSKRLRRYLDANPSCACLLLTGTPGSDSVTQYAHLQELLHGAASPLPRPSDFWYSLNSWAEATDAHVRGQRRPSGALSVLAGGADDLGAVRDGIGRRVEETAGNIYARGKEGLDCSVYVSELAHKADLSTIDIYCRSALDDEMLPDGRVFAEVYDSATILKQLGLGYCKALDPIPPEPWREARGLWASFVREVVSQEALRLDTGLQVAGAVRRGEIDDGGLYQAWRDIEPTFTPTHTTVWVTDAVVNVCADWLRSEKGLLWCPYPTMGRRVAEAAGVPFFHSRGVDPVAGSIVTYPGGTGAVLSFSNAQGLNLQDRWHKNLFIAPPAGATILDQAIGRTVRRFQKEPTVEVSFLLTVAEHWGALNKARTAAEVDRAMGRNTASRLLMGDWTTPGAYEIMQRRGPRWERPHTTGS